MFEAKFLKDALTRTTALVGAGLLLAPTLARAASITVGAATNTTVTLNAGDTLTITNTGSISGASPAVTVSAGVAATSVNNNGGRISAASMGINVAGKGTSLTGGITNSGVISVAGAAVNVAAGGSVEGGVTLANSGIILAQTAVRVVGGGTITGDVRNSGLIQAINAGIVVEGAGSSIQGNVINALGAQLIANNEGILIDTNAFINGSISNLGAIAGNAGTANGVVVSGSSTISGGILNSGSINSGSTGGTGIRVTTGSLVLGGISDSGTIHGAAHGIFNAGTVSGFNGILVKNGTLSGGIDNTGTLIGLLGGIAIESTSNVSGGIANTGVIHGNTYGILVDPATITGGIQNAVGATISGGPSGIAILTNSVLQGGIDNKGLISGSSIGIDNAGTISGASAAINVHSGGSIVNGVVNSGLIQGSSSGIRVSGLGSSITGGINNKGTISGTAGINIMASAGVTGGITNSGRILGTNQGVLVQIAGTLTGSVTNNAGGLIRGSSGVGVNVSKAGTINGSIANAGTISGHTGIAVFSSGSVTGGITSSGTITGTGGVAIVLSKVGAPVPITINGGVINGNVLDATPAIGTSPVTIGGNFTTNGNFGVSSVTVNGGNTLTISSGNTVTMNNMPVSAGKFNFDVTSPAVRGEIVTTTGALTLTPGQIKVSVVGGGLANNDAILIADGAAADTTAPQAVASSSALWNFQVEDGGQTGLSDNTDLWLIATSNASTVVAPGSGDASALAALLGLNAKQLSGNGGQLGVIVTNVNNAGTGAALDGVLDSVQPDVSGGALYSVQNLTETVGGIISDALDGKTDSASGLSSGNMPGNLRGWGEVFAQTAHMGERDGIEGYNANSAGFAMGVDNKNKFRGMLLGGSLAYGHTSVDAADTNSASTQINSYQLSVYGEYPLDDRTYLRAIAAYSRNDDDTARYNVGGVPGLTARGSYAADDYTLQANAGRHFYQGGGLVLTPTALARYSWYDPRSYTESGAGAADLNVRQHSVNLFELGIGGEAAWHFRHKDGTIFVPALHAGYRYDMGDDRVATNETFTGGGATFTSTGPRPARSRLNLGGDLNWYTTSAWEFKATYNMDYRDRYLAHTGQVRAVVNY